MGELTDLGVVLGKQVGAMEEELGGTRWMGAACFSFRFFLKKKKLLLFFPLTKVIHVCCGKFRTYWKAI